MIDISDDERRRAFSMWLRSGRLPSARSADGIELKFNPWHDPETGRFTFVDGGFSGGGGGKGGGGGTTGSWGRPARPSQPKSQNPASRAIPKEPARAASPSSRPAPSQSSVRGAWTSGGFTGGGGGSSGGGGATATEAWGPPEPKRPRGSAPATEFLHLSGTTSRSTPSPNAQSEQFRTVVRNGYTYQIDVQTRTRRVAGILTFADAPSRSRTSQRQAGGMERRASDDGGHYIAARFNGPTEAFNHFAQDANFNRGGYRLLEDEWAREKRAGRAVAVKIVPQFSGDSVRPAMIDVWWTVDGKEKSVKFPNQRSERRRGGN